MNIFLTPSQDNLFNKITNEFKYPTISRTNYIITGESGVGKTLLAKHLCKQKNGEYIAFTKNYGESFFNHTDLLDIDGTDLLEFIKTSIIKDKREKLFAIDDIEYIFNYMYFNRKINNFLRIFKRYSFFNKIILIIPSMYLNKPFDENVFELMFTEKDRNFLANYYSVARSIAMDYGNGYYF